MSHSFPFLFPGMLLDAASRFAQDQAAAPAAGGDDPIRAMGWACTLVPEEFGGVGGTLADLAAIVEGLAAHGVRLPVVEACAAAPLWLLAAQEPAAGGRWLSALCEGQAAIAPLTATSDPLDVIRLQAASAGAGFALSGEVPGVDLTLMPTHWLLTARLEGSGETAIFLVEAAQLPAPTARYRSMEGRPSADFRLQGFALPPDACIARGDAARQALDQADDAALLLGAVDTVAALATLVQATITHLKERRQFGVALASFQVLRHRTADMYVRYVAAKGLLAHALRAHEERAPDLRRTLRLAKLALAETARACAEAAIQMHGGMGVSEEVLATRIAQRLLASDFRHGDRLTQCARLLAQPADAQPELSRSAP